jgi:hypothetical protein
MPEACIRASSEGKKNLKKILMLFTILSFFAVIIASSKAITETTKKTTFAVIGDYGSRNSDELAVANLVKSLHPGFIITVGDNYQPRSSLTHRQLVESISYFEICVGAYYDEYLRDGNFYPTIGNHDREHARDYGFIYYTTYFNNPSQSSGNERYYDFVRGPVHFYSLNSNTNEPDGTKKGSIQHTWFKNQISKSTSTWNIVYFHHSPYTSNENEGIAPIRWKFEDYGVDAVLSGHNHYYERLIVNGIPYFVNGAGGGHLSDFGVIDERSIARVKQHGAMKVTANQTSINFKFINVYGKVLDEYTIVRAITEQHPTTEQQELLTKIKPRVTLRFIMTPIRPLKSIIISVRSRELPAKYSDQLKEYDLLDQYR